MTTKCCETCGATELLGSATGGSHRGRRAEDETGTRPGWILRKTRGFWPFPVAWFSVSRYLGKTVSWEWLRPGIDLAPTMLSFQPWGGCLVRERIVMIILMQDDVAMGGNVKNTA